MSPYIWCRSPSTSRSSAGFANAGDKNCTKSRVRAKVESPFRILKHAFAYTKVLYRGI
jgi:hypothetical protein